MPALSLLDHLAERTDPRDRKGRQYPLVPLLALALLAILAGNTSVVATGTGTRRASSYGPRTPRRRRRWSPR